MRARTLFLCGLALATSIAVAPPARALDVRVEVAPIFSLPFNAVLDGIPLPEGTIDVVRVADALGFQVNEGVLNQFGIPREQDVTSLVDLTQKVGFGVRLALLLNDWEIRYEFVAYGYDELVYTHVNFPDLTQVGQAVFFPVEGALTLDATSLDSMFLHNLGVGYRFTPFDWIVRPYVPLSLGFAAVQLRNDLGALYGFNIQVGLGVVWDAWKSLRLSLDMRYGISVFMNQDTSLGGIQQRGIASAGTNASTFEAVVETLSTLNFGLQVSWGF
jgi:hypothetical protein